MCPHVFVASTCTTPEHGGSQAGPAGVNSQGAQAPRAEKRGLGHWIEIKCVVRARPTCALKFLLKFLQVVGLFKATTGETGDCGKFCVAVIQQAQESSACCCSGRGGAGLCISMVSPH